jgi:molybdopterin synthase sulfur carrier subunit
MATLRLFAAAREAAGTGRDAIDAGTVGEVLDEARRRYGAGFAAVLDRSRVWRNGEPAAAGEPVGRDDEVAVLPPVSGGCSAYGAALVALKI